MEKSIKVLDQLGNSVENCQPKKKLRKFYIYDKDILEKLCANSEFDSNNAISEDELEPENFDTTGIKEDELDIKNQNINPRNLISSIQILIQKHKISDVIVNDLLKALHSANPKCPLDIKSFMKLNDSSLRLIEESEIEPVGPQNVSPELDSRVTNMEKTLSKLNNMVSNLVKSIKTKNKNSFRKPLILNEDKDNELHLPISNADEFDTLNERLTDTDFCKTFIECLLRRVPLVDLALEGWLSKVFTNIFDEEFLLEFTWNKIKPKYLAKVLETIVMQHFQGIDYTYFARRASDTMRHCTFKIRKRLKEENCIEEFDDSEN